MTDPRRIEPPGDFDAWPRLLRDLCMRAEVAIEASHRLREQADQMLRQTDQLRRTSLTSVGDIVRRVRAR